MNSFTERIKIETREKTDIVNITDPVKDIVGKSGIEEGLCSVSVIGSTASVSTMEYESGLVEDLADYYERIIPSDIRYMHNEKWHDGNGYSHIRSTTTKTSQTFQIEKGSILLGTWQQIIFIDFDNKPRNREISVKIIGR
ncbi:MAG: secondary thiamine-phosphate synthase enzyme YjbQ [candidate division WOR-3 bacterium]|nr:secondary thiamine-phosphate synthase enzyme YjbQ [candidate division WOR-3 bacterium]